MKKSPRMLDVSVENSLPVFVDATGRRMRRLRRAGYAVAGLCALYAGTVGVSLLGAPISPHDLLPLPGKPDKEMVVEGHVASPKPTDPGKAPFDLVPPDTVTRLGGIALDGDRAGPPAPPPGTANDSDGTTARRPPQDPPSQDPTADPSAEDPPPASPQQDPRDEPPSPSQPRPSPKPSVQDPPAQDPPVQGPTEESPAEDPPAQDPPAEDTPAEDTPAEDTPAEDTPAQDTPTRDIPQEPQSPPQQVATDPDDSVTLPSSPPASPVPSAVPRPDPTDDSGGN